MELNGRAKNITGQKFSRLTAIGPVSRTKHNKIMWLFQCDCGGECTCIISNVLNGATSSCGCFARELRTSHGLSYQRRYRVYRDMLDRCYSVTHKNYHRYGGRGISVYQEWRDNPQAFFDVVGARPTPQHSIDRIDNDGNYEPGNVRWATREQQSNNTRFNHLLTFENKTLTVTQWAKRIKVNRGTLYSRLVAGWSDEKVLSTPIATKRFGK